METSTNLNQLKKIISDVVGIEEIEISPESHFINDLGCDSLLLSELIMKIEDHFEIRIPDQEVQNLKTVRQVTEYLQNQNNNPEITN